MRFLPRVVVLLIIASGLLDIFFWNANPASSWPDWITVWFVALIYSQISLLAAWLAVGRAWFMFRMLFSSLGFAFIYLLIPGENFDVNGLVYLCFAQGLLVSLLMLVLRAIGFQISLRGPENSEPDSKSVQFQFSIVQILLVTTALAICTAIGVRLKLEEKILWEGAWLAVSFGAPAPFIFWAVLAESIRILRMIAVLVLLAGMAILLAMFWPEQFECVLLAAICGLQYALCIASLFVVRRAGYRFTRPARQVAAV
ncbi:MAG TPA: hypothetical protein VGJ15_10020 [Pirellulales bacterium]|jgi:hypothetical protein